MVKTMLKIICFLVTACYMVLSLSWLTIVVSLAYEKIHKYKQSSTKAIEEIWDETAKRFKEDTDNKITMGFM